MNAPLADADADAAPEPTEPARTAPRAAAAPGFAIQLNRVPLLAPLQWLRLGWRDFTRAPSIGLFYGACFAAMGWLLLALFEHAPAYVLALSAGFLLVGPFLCLGLYDTSRRLERGDRPRLAASLVAWRTRAGTMAIFGAVLLTLEMLWARASLIVFALSFSGIPDFKGSLLALLERDNVGFVVAYVAVGSVFAGLIFTVCVVAMPMILDRETDAITAGLTSIRLCVTQPMPMLLWGALITLLVAAAMAPWFAGLLLVAPVLGHASWHAYRSVVAGVP